MQIVNKNNSMQNGSMETGGAVACVLGCGSICLLTQWAGAAFASVAVVS